MHNLEAAKHFLHSLDPHAEQFTFQVFKERESSKISPHIINDSIDNIFDDLVEVNKAGGGIFVTVNQTDLKGRKAENITAVRALYLDDDGEVIDPDIEPSIVVKTSAGKRHLYYRINSDEWTLDEYKRYQAAFVTKYKGDKAAKDLTRVLRVPGFYHMKNADAPCMVTHECFSDHIFSKAEIESLVDLSQEVVTLVTQKTQNLPTGAFKLQETILDGERNDTLFKYACSLRSQGCDTDDIRKKVSQANDTLTVDPLKVVELNKLLDSALSYPNDKTFYCNTEMGNSERFCDEWQEVALFCVDKKKWHLWNERVWQRDDVQRIIEYAKKTAKNMMLDAKSRTSEDAAKWASGSQSRARLSSMVALSESVLACRQNKFDQQDMQLSVNNGIVDLHKGQLIEPKKEFFHSLTAPVDYDPAATCPIFEKFLNTIFQGDKELIEYVQRIMGYTLTGDTREQCIFILLGDGRNGKSTLLNTLIALMGPYHKRANADTFMTSNKSSIRTDLARLEGCRLVTGSEATDDDYWNEALIKDISGGEKITARQLYENEKEFLPKFKLMIAVNTLPQIKGIDHGIWRRIRFIPFEYKIEKKDIDYTLGDKLRAELPGILNFALAGLKAWQNNGLSMPPSVEKKVKIYRKEMDKVQAFIDEACKLGDDSITPASDLYNHYRSWATGSGHQALSSTKFGRRLKHKGFKTKKERFGNEVKHVYLEIALVDDDFSDDY